MLAMLKNCVFIQTGIEQRVVALDRRHAALKFGRQGLGALRGQTARDSTARLRGELYCTQPLLLHRIIDCSNCCRRCIVPLRRVHMFTVLVAARYAPAARPAFEK